MCMHTHCLHVHGCSTIPSSMGSYLEAVSRRKLTLFHFQQLSIAKSCCSVWWDSLSSSPTNAAFCWLELVQVSCVQSQALWVRVCNSPVMSSRSFHCRHSWPLSTPCLKWSPSLVEREHDIDLLFRDEPYTVFYCLHTDWLSVPFFLPLTGKWQLPASYRVPGIVESSQMSVLKWRNI